MGPQLFRPLRVRVVTTSTVTVKPVRWLSLCCPGFSSEVNHFPLWVAVTLESVTRLQVSTGSQIYQRHDDTSQRGQELKELFCFACVGFPGLYLTFVPHFLICVSLFLFLVSDFLFLLLVLPNCNYCLGTSWCVGHICLTATVHLTLAKMNPMPYTLDRRLVRDLQWTTFCW